MLAQVRIYRIWTFVRGLERASALSLAFFTIARNVQLILCIVHVAACLFYYLTDLLYYRSDEAAVNNGSPDTVDSWFELTLAEVEALSTFDRYVTSFYWSMTTFTTVGYGDISPVTTPEQIFVVVRDRQTRSAVNTIRLAMLAFNV